MDQPNNPKKMKTYFKTALLTALCLLLIRTGTTFAQAFTSFEGEKTSWNGFDRYDYFMDMETFAITPFKALPTEKTGMDDKNTPKGKVRCIVIVPKTAAPGNPVT